MKTVNICICVLICLLGFLSCKESGVSNRNNAFWIDEPGKQDSVFQQLEAITYGAVAGEKLRDSLAFLIVPIRESCPSCLDKTIDSILSYKDRLDERCIIVISMAAGRKTVNSYFRERKGELPIIPGQLILDSINLAAKFNLFEANPAIYYTFEGKAYKRVNAYPRTVKQDLHNFFNKHL
ncbi:hypothetical protein [Chitinophaga niabensis]|uniref:AhpC/TSA family protein n=1 Tax=Chitinophaga niabensis TaxID=536979 RepID=A0A1N6JBF8_9BACT|nr:hypothetical protein [Chitinophaga niabensis]SIO41694.1 hypothetical protein SAMN04488055_3835 [Chitinophaga niabensis]